MSQPPTPPPDEVYQQTLDVPSVEGVVVAPPPPPRPAQTVAAVPPPGVDRDEQA